MHSARVLRIGANVFQIGGYEAVARRHNSKSAVAGPTDLVRPSDLAQLVDLSDIGDHIHRAVEGRNGILIRYHTLD